MNFWMRLSRYLMVLKRLSIISNELRISIYASFPVKDDAKQKYHKHYK
jgi:hypothetical protein